MDIIKILSTLQNNNINLSQLVTSISSLFNNKNPTNQNSHNNTDYYNLPSYNFDTKPQNSSSTMQGTTQRIVPNKTAYLSQKPQNADFNKIAEIAQLLLPLLSSKNTPETTSNTTHTTQELPESQILKLPQVPSD